MKTAAPTALTSLLEKYDDPNLSSSPPHICATSPLPQSLPWPTLFPRAPSFPRLISPARANLWEETTCAAGAAATTRGALQCSGRGELRRQASPAAATGFPTARCARPRRRPRTCPRGRKDSSSCGSRAAELVDLL